MCGGRADYSAECLWSRVTQCTHTSQSILNCTTYYYYNTALIYGTHRQTHTRLITHRNSLWVFGCVFVHVCRVCARSSEIYNEIFMENDKKGWSALEWVVFVCTPVENNNKQEWLFDAIVYIYRIFAISMQTHNGIWWLNSTNIIHNYEMFDVWWAIWVFVHCINFKLILC